MSSACESKSETAIERRHPDAQCEKCTLNTDGSVFVPSIGSAASKVAIVGEAPGFQEAQLGRPFVGPSGQLLDAVLSHGKVNRDEALVTNAVLCRPPDNRTPSKLEVSCCRDRLLAEVGQATKILALGNVAAQSILGTKEGITKLRVGPPKNHNGQRVVPSFHPAAVLRNPDLFPSLVTDVEKLSNDKDIRWVEPNWRAYDDHRAVDVLMELGRYDHIVLDIETSFDKDSEFSRVQKLLCIGFSYAPGKAVVIGERALTDPLVQAELARLLKRTKIIAHNGKFDLQGLWAFGKPELWFDTMLASYAVDERQGTHSLKYLAKEILGAPDWDLHFARSKDFGEMPRDLLYEYNACDVVATYALYEHYKNDNRKLHDFLVEASNQLMHVEQGGVKVDEDYLAQLEVKLTTELAVKEEALTRWVANPRSPVQVKEALSVLGRPVESTNKKTLGNLLDKLSVPAEVKQLALELLDYRKSHKLLATYVNGLRSRLWNGRVYPSYLLHGTTTGRLSSRNPNLQNQPRGELIRNLFVPEAGNVFIQADYKTIELRVLAVLANDPTLQEIFRSGADVHDIFTGLIYGDGWTKEQRSIVKTFVYGCAYGETANSAASRLRIPVGHAEAVQSKLMARMPNVLQFREELKQAVLVRGEDLQTPFGRRRRFNLITDQNKDDILKESYAYYPQSIASDICLSALCRVRRDLEGIAAVRIPVHDSILVECDKADQEQVSRRMAKIMEETAADAYSDYVPFPVDVGIGDRWGSLAS